jgi:hypothetical protein
MSGNYVCGTQKKKTKRLQGSGTITGLDEALNSSVSNGKLQLLCKDSDSSCNLHIPLIWGEVRVNEITPPPPTVQNRQSGFHSVLCQHQPNDLALALPASLSALLPAEWLALDNR